MTYQSVDKKVITHESKDERLCPYVYNWNNGTFSEWTLIHLQDLEVANRSTLCINNLPVDVTLRYLSDMFRPFGHVESINMINPTSCKVVYLDSQRANLAMWKIDGGIYSGHIMTVDKVT